VKSLEKEEKKKRRERKTKDSTKKQIKVRTFRPLDLGKDMSKNQLIIIKTL